MNRTQKTPTGAAIASEGRAGKAADNTSIPICNCTPNVATGQLAIADYLGHSRETARTGRELCAALDVDSRTLRQRIEAERRAGALIVADNASGYWLTADPGEAQRFARSMQHRAREILRTARAIERAAGLL